MRGWQKGVLGGVFAIVLAIPARADIYMYTDTRGGLHFSMAPTEPQYQYYLPDISSWKTYGRGGFGATGGPRRRVFDSIIRDAARRHQVDAALVKAVIRAESDFVPRAVSPKGAQGLMQLMPATARRHNVWRSFEPRDNVEGGVVHLRYLLDRYGGNLRLALAAYNAGEKAVDAHGGVPPFPETWEYLARVMRFRDSYLREQ
ncbi:MAG: lytic transglycosylase domain-containing protein [Candidatus Binatia bacterium]